MNAAFKEQLALANAHYREGRFNEAEQRYSQLHALDSQNPTILAQLGEIALLKNQPTVAEAYFQKAFNHTSRLAKLWPFNIQLNTSLATTYYRQDNFSQAAKHYRQAAGPIVFGPFRDLKAMAAQLDLFRGQMPYAIESPTTARIPFTLTDPLPVLQVSVNGCEPVPFFIDTGCAEVIIDSQFAEKIRATRAGKLRGEGGGTKGSIELGKVDALALGDLTIRHVPVHVMDTNPFAAVFDGLSVKGVIGTRLLMHFLATIDYVNACLILRPATAQVDTLGAKTIPFWLAQTHYMVTYGALNGRASGLFFVDTGLADKGFSASDSTLREAGITPDWSKAGTGVAAFGASETVDVLAESVTLGVRDNEVTVQNLPGVVFKKPFGILGYKLGFNIIGVVSHEFFRNYALTLDYVGMRLILHG